MTLRRLGSAAPLLLLAACSVSSNQRPTEVAAGPGYIPGQMAAPPPVGQAAPRQNFEGFLDYRYSDGPPPGETTNVSCVVRGPDLRCDLTKPGESNVFGALGFRGEFQHLCFRVGPSPWIQLNLATVGYLFSVLPPSVRKQAVKKTQDSYRFTGRADQLLGHSCHEIETRDDDGSTSVYCYADSDYFEGNARLLPLLRQMGFDAKFTGNMDVGFGLRGTDYDKSGKPTSHIEVTSIRPGRVDPAALAGVCVI
jgi:hypothetical protein